MNRILVCSFAAGLAGCVPLGSQGSLQNGSFAYVCNSQEAAATDEGCSPSLTDEEDVPAAIAVGAHFDLQYNVSSSSDSGVIQGLVSAAPTLLSPQPSTTAGAFGFSFSSPGVVAVLATTSGGVADFVHLTGAKLDHLALTDEGNGAVTSITLSGDTSAAETTITATPVSATEQSLAGAMTYTWTTSDPTVVGVEPIDELFGPNPSNQMTLVPAGTGTATVTVSVPGAQATLDVTVNGGTP